MLSTTTIAGVAGEVFPAASVAVIESGVVHSPRAGARSIDHVPDALTVPVQRTVPEPSFTVMIAPTSPVPVIVGVESLVRYGDVVSPPTERTVGARGAIVSMTTVAGVVGD